MYEDRCRFEHDPIPESQLMRSVMHVTKANGGYIYVHQGERSPGLRHTITANRRRGPEVSCWTHALMPGRRFDNLELLLAAYANLTPEEACTAKPPPSAAKATRVTRSISAVTRPLRSPGGT